MESRFASPGREDHESCTHCHKCGLLVDVGHLPPGTVNIGVQLQPQATPIEELRHAWRADDTRRAPTT